MSRTVAAIHHFIMLLREVIYKSINQNLCSKIIEISFYSGFLQIAQMLIMNGADVNSKTPVYGHTPLGHAALRGNF